MTGALFADRPYVPTNDDGGHAPRPPRTNLLLSATLETTDGERAVRVRNLSEGGAMLEGADLPASGERLLLRRTALSIAGTCAWTSATRCGVRFDRPISVPQWATGNRAATSAGQQRVDALQAAIRAGGAVALSDPLVTTPARATVLRNVADEIVAAAQVLRALSDRLAEDMAVIAAHGDDLQRLDPLSQTLDHLARVLAAADPAPVIEAIGMDDLRARLTRPRSR